MNEIDFDYEEPSLDPFGGEFSGSDDSENEDEPAVVNRDSLKNICHQHLNFLVFSFENIYKLKRIFEEVSQEEWLEFQNRPRFKDKAFKPQKLSPTIGYKRDGITEEMLNDPKQLYQYVYGSSSSGMLIYIFLPKSMSAKP